MKKLKKACLSIFLVIICGHSSFSQDTHNFTQFFFNPALLNPSFTGSDGRLAMYASFRKQWAGIAGAPTIGNFSIQTALPNKLNLGFNASNDKNGLLSTSGLLFTGGYSLPVSDVNFFRFGISIGAAWNKVDINALNFSTPGDPVTASLLASNFQVLGNVGFSFHTPTFHVGLSVPNIFEPAYLSSESFSVSKVNPFGSIIAHASNRFYFSDDKNIFEPYLVYRYNQNAPSQVEAAAVVHLQNLVWVGGSFKQNFGISALAGIKLKGQTAIGYSYSLKNTGTNELSAPSHEIHIGILVGKRDKKIPMYSFVDAEKEKAPAKTPQQIAAEKKKAAAELAKKKDEEKKKEELEAKLKEEEKKKQELEARERQEREAALAVHKADSLAEQANLTQLENQVANPTEEHNEIPPAVERHEFVKRGSNPNELETGDYVIAGVFKVKENAKKYSDGLRKFGFDEAAYGYLTEKGFWYVHIAKSDDITAMRAYRDKFRKMKIFREAWLLSVSK